MWPPNLELPVSVGKLDLLFELAFGMELHLTLRHMTTCSSKQPRRTMTTKWSDVIRSKMQGFPDPGVEDPKIWGSFAKENVSYPYVGTMSWLANRMHSVGLTAVLKHKIRMQKPGSALFSQDIQPIMNGNLDPCAPHGL